MSRSRKMVYSQFTHRRIEVWQGVAENALGRPLPAGAEIHHVDEDRSNNAGSNLVICPNRAYHNLLHLRAQAYDAGYPVHYRKCPYCKRYDDPVNMLLIQVAPQRPSGTAIHRQCRMEDQAWRKLR